MDCGPAALKSLLDGFGIQVSYGRLREACQTDVDGTSIDTMEEIAIQLGLDAEQIMVPRDHLLLGSAKTLPAIVVVRQANGVTHFTVAWRRVGKWIQLMDPATGRRWTKAESLVNSVYVHTMPVPAEDWREWAGSEDFLAPLQERFNRLGAGRLGKSHITAALKDEGWRSIATLDAALRMGQSLVDVGGLRSGSGAGKLVHSLYERALSSPEEEVIPNSFWSAFLPPAPPVGQAEAEPGGAPDVVAAEELYFRGAVLVRALGKRTQSAEQDEDQPALSPEIVAALDEKPTSPGRELWRLMREGGLFHPLMLLFALIMAAGATIVQALVFRGILDIGRDLGLTEQRLGTIAAILLFLLASLLLEYPIASGMLRLGRQLEVRMRLAFVRKIPRLRDRYFQSRLTSDMAERGHMIQGLRMWPQLVGQLLRSSFSLVFTTAGVIWLAPEALWLALTVAALSIALPLTTQPMLTERDLRVRTHVGALSRFYLDVLLGLVPVLTHGAQRSVRSEHESLLVEWTRAAMGLQKIAVVIEAVLAFSGYGLAAWLVMAHLNSEAELGTLLLLVYWSLQLPALGQEVARIALQYPAQRNMTLRVLEPLGAPEEAEVKPANTERKRHASFSEKALLRGVGIEMEKVSIRAAGHTILDQMDLSVAPGEHIAVVGSSGAGKSSFVGLLLGWHRASGGKIQIDGKPLNSERIATLRGQSAWVDPAVQLWNRSFLDNLSYGIMPDRAAPMAAVLGAAHLQDLLQRLPEGLQTQLGEGGALVSGGQGQRVRYGRALMRADARLAILDEPFRGLDRERREQLLKNARAWWRQATLLCITHDVSQTLVFDRVLVIDGGKLVEDASPKALLEQPGSRFRALYDAEQSVRNELWSGANWRKQSLTDGVLTEEGQ
jgi:ABC-type bacteriocin/lantibiotic exporter with double-glycine peptidase domain